MLMRNTSAPASNRRAIMRRIAGGRTERGDDLGAAQASHRAAPARGNGTGACRRPGVGSIGTPGVSGRRCGCSAVSVSCTVQAALLAGVDLEEAGAVEAARQAVVGAADGEFLVARAHEGLARPFAAAIVVDRIDVIEAGDQRSLQQRLAAARRQIPPALGGPAARRPCSRSRCRPGCRCCCRGGNRRAAGAGEPSAAPRRGRKSAATQAEPVRLAVPERPRLHRPLHRLGRVSREGLTACQRQWRESR